MTPKEVEIICNIAKEMMFDPSRVHITATFHNQAVIREAEQSGLITGEKTCESCKQIIDFESCTILHASMERIDNFYCSEWKETDK